MSADATLAALAALGSTTLLALLTWAVSVRRHDVSLVDRMWPLFIAAAATAAAVVLPGGSARGVWMLVLTGLWAARLCLYITLRNWGHGEDRRYQAIRARNQPGFAWKSLFLVFGLQALLACVVAAPFLVGWSAERPLGVIGVLGILLAGFGIVFESVADAQLARFKADPGNRGRVLDRGLWGLSRHPNYFGEACTWWGLWLLAVSGGGPGSAWTVVSPLLMTLLLLKVSGVSLLEKDIGERRPAYRDYIARTPAFVPGWPRPRRLPNRSSDP